MKIKELLGKMTLREKIYQTIIIHADEKFYNADTGFLEEYAKAKPYGGVFVGEEIIGGAIATGDDIKNAISRYVAKTQIQPVICADTEFGCGYMYPDGRYSDCPWQMALGAANDKELAYDYGKYTAIAAKEIGINLSLAPVADINMNFHNPVVNTRAVGDKPRLVADMVCEVSKGMQEYGLGATAKHFPGDGTDYRDQHYVLTNNTLSVEAWKKSFGIVYKRLIDEGIMCIMAGHLAFPAYQKRRLDEVALPATLSEELVTGLLKNEMNFNGVVMSDALCMNGFRSFFGSQERSEIECFKCGVDMMLWPSESFADNLEKAVSSGEVSEKRLDDAVERILCMKERLGLLDAKPVFKHDSIEGIHDLDRRISENAVTLVRDRRNELPKNDIKRIAIIAITKFDDEFDSLQCMKTELESRGAEVFLYRDEVPGDNWEKNLDLIIYVSFCRQHKPCGPLAITPSWQTASHEREKVVAVALGSPYLLNSNFPTANMAIAAYSATEGCQKAVVKAIFGEIPFKGKLPVSLPQI